MSSNPNIAISVENVGKTYKIYKSPEDRLKQFIYPKAQSLFRRPIKNYHEEFSALTNINLEVAKGETVGLVGKNGSGKSTLLQIICDTLSPTTGNVRTHGRIAALLELGSGFNPEFTGRENIYLNGAILGLNKEAVDKYFEKIVSFADIGEFLDRPVKTYSSGMGVRLAFAVQAQIEPDILIVDEALAVGDAKFQTKCFNHLKRLKENGTSILLVTHSTEQIVTHCDRAFLLDRGKIHAHGEPRVVVNKYLDLLFGKEAHQITPDQVAHNGSNSQNETEKVASSGLSIYTKKFNTRPNYNPHEHRWGDLRAELLDFLVEAHQEVYPTTVKSGSLVKLEFSVKFNSEVVRPIYGITVKTKEGVTVYGKNTLLVPDTENIAAGELGSISIVRAEFYANIGPGDYFISVGVASKNQEEVVPHDRRYDSIHLTIEDTEEFHGIADLKLEIDTENFAHD